MCNVKLVVREFSPIVHILSYGIHIIASGIASGGWEKGLNKNHVWGSDHLFHRDRQPEVAWRA